jgi:hypothetical protein
LALPNYANNLLRSGFSPENLAAASDRLFDAIIAWGDEDAIMRPAQIMSASRRWSPTKQPSAAGSGVESPQPAAASLLHMALSKDEREEFLAQPHIAALSVYAGDTRGPLTVPIWYQYTPGGEPWVLTGAGSRKARLIEAAGYFSLMAERVDPTVRYAAVDGPVSRIEPGTDDQLVELTRRYMPPERVDAYLEYARNELGESVAIYLQPQHWLSADLGEL